MDINDYTLMVTDWRSIYLATAMSFCANLQFSLLFPSMWPFLKLVDKDATEQFFGIIFAAYSLAGCISSPLFGYWSNRAKQIKRSMYAGLASMMIGSILYLSTELFPSDRRYVVFVACCFMGIGSANPPLLRAYASTSCLPSERPLALAYLNVGISMAVATGPALQVCLTWLGYPGMVLTGKLGLNNFTAAALAAFAVNVLCGLMLAFLFDETYRGIVEEDEEKEVRLPRYDPIAVSVCFMTFFAEQFFFANLDLTSASFALVVFAFTNQETVRYGSIAQTSLGMLAFVTYTSYIAFKLVHIIRHRLVIIFALGLLFGFLLVTYPWFFISGGLTTYTNHDLQNATSELVGCNQDTYSWCDSMKPVNPWVFYIAFAICLGLAIPYVENCNNTVYGQVLGPRKQGTMQGFLQVSGSMAQILGPLVIGSIYTNHGPKVVWQLEMVILLATIAMWVVFNKRMVERQIQSDENTILVSENGYIDQ